MVIHNICTFVYAFALVCFFCLAGSKEELKDWIFNNILQLFSLLLTIGYVLMQMSKIWTTPNIFRSFWSRSLNHFFCLRKAGAGFIRNCLVKFLEEMLIHMTGWYFNFFSWLPIGLSTLSHNWIESVDVVLYFCLEYEVIYQTILSGAKELFLRHHSYPYETAQYQDNLAYYMQIFSFPNFSSFPYMYKFACRDYCYFSLDF